MLGSATDGQSLEAQHTALTAAGAERVFAEKQSGAKTDRAAFGSLHALAGGRGRAAGDEARSASALRRRDLLNTLDAIDEGWCPALSLWAIRGPIQRPHGQVDADGPRRTGRVRAVT